MLIYQIIIEINISILFFDSKNILFHYGYSKRIVSPALFSGETDN